MLYNTGLSRGRSNIKEGGSVVSKNIGVTVLIVLWIRKGRGTYGGWEYYVWSKSGEN